MALIECSECGKDVSDKALACPNCGNPINSMTSTAVRIATDPSQPLKIEPELTSKKWKAVKLISWGGIMLGLIIMSNVQTATFDNPSFGAGFSLLFFSIMALIVGYIGAWYADKRTR